MNPIKTPQEMLAELAGIPHMAGGSSVGQFTKQIAEAIAKYKRVYGKAPSPEEIKGLEQYVTNLSVPTPAPKLNPARLAATTPHPELLVDEAGYGYRAAQGPRGLTTPEQAKGYDVDPFGMSPINKAARKEAYELGTRQLKTKEGGDVFATLPTGLKVIEDRDAFLTKQMVDRTPSSTYLKPFTTSVDDFRANQAALEARGTYGTHTGTEPGGIPTQSITPSADYFANMAASVENRGLPDNLVSTLREKLGRQPTEDEVNAFIANLNVAQHDYTGLGSSVFGLKPEMPKGRPTKAQQAEIDAWRQRAIDSGEASSAVTATGSDLRNRYPSLQREVEMGPDTGMKMGGSVTPEQMRHMMLMSGRTPSKFAGGSAVRKLAAPAAINAGLFAPELTSMGKNLAKGKYGEVAGSAANIGLALAPFTPATVGLSLMIPSEIGDATLSTWNKQKAAEEKAYRDYIRATSPVFKEEAPVEYIDFIKELGYK